MFFKFGAIIFVSWTLSKFAIIAGIGLAESVVNETIPLSWVIIVWSSESQDAGPADFLQELKKLTLNIIVTLSWANQILTDADFGLDFLVLHQRFHFFHLFC